MIRARTLYPVAVLMAALLVGLAAFFLMNRSGGGTIASGAMLAQVGENSIQMSSFEYRLSGTKTADGQTTDGGELVVQFQMPDKTYAQENDANGTLLSESKTIGADQYTRRGGDTLWTKVTRASNPLADQPASVKASSLIESAVLFLDEVTLVGEEDVDGVTVAHWRGTTNMTRKANTVYWPNWDSLAEDKKTRLNDARQQFLRTTETVDVYVNKDDKLLIRTVTTSTLPSVGREEGYAATSTMAFSKYNDDFAITAPAESEIKPDLS